jgi:hypothetical protein
MKMKEVHTSPNTSPVGSPEPFEISKEAQPLFRHLWNKCTAPMGKGTDDDWSMLGEPHEWWDRKTGAPMSNFPRFDLQETSYAIALFSMRTPAWTEIYVDMMNGICDRWTTFWASVDFNTQFGDDPNNRSYPSAFKQFLPPGKYNEGYNIPGWIGNGTRQEHHRTSSETINNVVEPDVIDTRSMLFFKGWFALSYGIRAQIQGKLSDINKEFPIANVGDKSTNWSHNLIINKLSDMYLDHDGSGLN